MRRNLVNVLVIITSLSLSFGASAKGKDPEPLPVILKDANNNVVGRVIGMDYIDKPYVLTNEGYRTVISIFYGKVLFFDVSVFVQVECTGDKYIGLGGPTNLGTVYRLALSDDSYELFYTPYTEPHVSTTIYSYRDLDGNCHNLEPPLEKDIWPVYENNPNVTGIDNVVYLTNMLIE